MLPNRDNPEEMEKFASIVKKTFGPMHEFHDSFERFFSGYSKREEGFKFTDEQRRLYDQLNSNEIRSQRFSDGLLLSLSLRNYRNRGHMRGVSGILYSSGAMFLVMLSHGHPMRAGIEIGIAAEIYDKEIYGPALANADKLENHIAQYPRIVIGDELVRYITAIKQSKDDDVFTRANKVMVAETETMIAIDDDGQRIVDYLGEAFKARFASLEITKTVFDAYDFVLAQSAKWQTERNSKLAFRYTHLRNYFEKRLPIWKT